VLATTGWQLPALVEEPLQLLAGAAIPLMLLAYGAALRLSPLPGRAGHNREVVLIVVLKLGFMPVVAWLLARALGLEGPVLLGVVLTAALPTAQNIFLHATRYRVGENVARESILLTTLCSLPVALLVAVLLG
jgi:predicted permease